MSLKERLCNNNLGRFEENSVITTFRLGSLLTMLLLTLPMVGDCCARSRPCHEPRRRLSQLL